MRHRKTRPEGPSSCCYLSARAAGNEDHELAALTLTLTLTGKEDHELAEATARLERFVAPQLE